MAYRHTPDQWPWAFEAEQRMHPRSARAEHRDRHRKSLRPADARRPWRPSLLRDLAGRPNSVRRARRVGSGRGGLRGCAASACCVGARYDAPHAARPVTRYFSGWPGEARILGAAGSSLRIAGERAARSSRISRAGGRRLCLHRAGQPCGGRLQSGVARTRGDGHHHARTRSRGCGPGQVRDGVIGARALRNFTNEGQRPNRFKGGNT